MKAKVNKLSIELQIGEIWGLEVDAVVHSTDTHLTINRRLLQLVGSTLQDECQGIGWCDVGSAVITDAGKLPAGKIIHAAGPRWGEGSERGKLASATWNVLSLAEESQFKSIALPAISAGAMGYPLENCALTTLTEIIDFTFENLKYLKTIIICLENEIAFEVFKKEFRRQLETLKESGEGKVRV